jgi:hypothetical protein
LLRVEVVEHVFEAYNRSAARSTMLLRGEAGIAQFERTRTTAGPVIWLIRLVLVAAAYGLLWYAMRLLNDWSVRSAASFEPLAWDWVAALAIMLLAGTVFTLAARFPFPRPRYAWGRLLLALLIVLPPLHTTLLFSGWVTEPAWWFPSWLLRYRWFDSLPLAEVCVVLAGVAIGCGFGARHEPAADPSLVSR